MPPRPPRTPKPRPGPSLRSAELEAKYHRLLPSRCTYGQVGMDPLPALSRDFVLRGPVYFIGHVPLDDLQRFERRLMSQVLFDHANLPRIPWWSSVMATERNGDDPLATPASWCRMRRKDLDTLDAPPDLVGCYPFVSRYWTARKELAELVWRGGDRRYANGQPRQSRASRTITDRRIYLDMLDGFRASTDRTMRHAERIAANAERRADDAAHKAAARATGAMRRR